MKISVIIPTYNRVHLLSRALDSVFAQTNNVPLEIIVIDDGSTDDTAELIARSYPTVRYYKQNNQGVSAARNKGLAVAQGDWIALLDSDDQWLPAKLDRQLLAIANTNLKLCHTEEIWIRNGVRVNQMKKHRKHGGMIFDYCLPMCAMSPSSILIHHSVLDEVATQAQSVFDESLPACEDYDLWLRICSRYEVAFVNEPCIYKFGGHEDQLSRQHWGMDRFRVIALEKLLLDNEYLGESMVEAATAMLISKVNILLAGARKHANHELINECQSRLLRWS